MSISALMVTALLEHLTPGPRMASCTFPPTEPGGRPITVSVEPRPSLMDVEHRFRVRLHLGGEAHIAGLAQPIDRTEERDVLIRARASGEFSYTIGVRDDGLAALNLLPLGGIVEGQRAETRKGACRGFSLLLDAWLRS